MLDRGKISLAGHALRALADLEEVSDTVQAKIASFRAARTEKTPTKFNEIDVNSVKSHGFSLNSKRDFEVNCSGFN